MGGIQSSRSTPKSSHISSFITAQNHPTALCGELISVCTSPRTINCAGYVAILNKRTTSSHQRSIHLDHTRQTSSKHSSDIAISAPSHASFIRISRHATTTTSIQDTQGKRKRFIGNLMQDIRNSQTPLIFAASSRIFGRCPSSIRQICMRKRSESHRLNSRDE